MQEEAGTVDRGDGTGLAWAGLPGSGPTVVFLGGFRSDMTGSKALFLRDRCAARGQRFLRLDYSGHGASGGRFEDGTISRWTEDAAAVIAARAPGPLVLVGSSMGGWIALLLARGWGAARVRALVGIAAAPDFTEDLIPAELTVADHEALARDGIIYRPSEYGDPIPYTAALLRDGARNLVLRDRRRLGCPVHLLQGMADPDVPWRHALRVVEALDDPGVLLTLIKDGDHRLSRPSDLALLWRAVDPFLREDAA